MSNNQIEQIDIDGFKGLENLKELDLRQNELSVVESKSFPHFKNIKILNFGKKSIYLLLTLIKDLFF